jgi:hypothetical protein
MSVPTTTIVTKIRLLVDVPLASGGKWHAGQEFFVTGFSSYRKPNGSEVETWWTGEGESFGVCFHLTLRDEWFEFLRPPTNLSPS